MNDEIKKRIIDKPWQPGQSDNPGDRPPDTRNRFSEAFIADVAEAWATHRTEIRERWL
jgi:hypothetical protein